VGLNERDAPLELLERVTVHERELPKELARLCDGANVSEAVILSTCLRTEVYAVVDRFHDGIADIEAFFESRLGDSGPRPPRLAEQLGVTFDDAAAEHLFEVAAGIDSAVLGEGEILRQVRRAEEVARAERASGPLLGGLFRHAVLAGKRARAETAIARGVTSLAHVAVGLAARRCGGLAGRQVVVLGAGEMGDGIVAALGAERDRPSVAVVNRSLGRARELAAAVGGRPLPLASLPEELVAADVLIAAAAADEVLLEAEQFVRALAERGDRPLFVVDVAVPRNVDPSVAQLPGVELFDLDDLRQVAEEEMAARRAEVGRVRAILVEELARYRASVLGRSVAPVVSALRARAEEVRAGELERSRALLEALQPAQAEAVEALTRRIVAKLLHEPSVQVKRAAGSPRGERLAEALRQLFEL
jgi:glutamyl-tRNA reductase